MIFARFIASWSAQTNEKKKIPVEAIRSGGYNDLGECVEGRFFFYGKMIGLNIFQCVGAV